MRPDQRHSRRAFTLTDLAGFLFIIAGLAAILIPWLANTRKRANRARCANNLRQMGAALLAYSTSERDHSFPRTAYDRTQAALAQPWTRGYGFQPGEASDSFAPAVGANNVGASFFLILKAGGVTPADFICPSTGGSRGFTSGNVADSSNFRSFGDTGAPDCTYSYQVPFPDADAAAAKFRFTSGLPADFAMAADINPGINPAADPATNTTTVRFDDSETARRAGNSRNHRGTGQNVLYADGHVEWHVTPFCGPHRSPQSDPGINAYFRDNIYANSEGIHLGDGTGGKADATALVHDLYDGMLLPVDH